MLETMISQIGEMERDRKDREHMHRQEEWVDGLQKVEDKHQTMQRQLQRKLTLFCLVALRSLAHSTLEKRMPCLVSNTGFHGKQKAYITNKSSSMKPGVRTKIHDSGL